MMIRPLNSLEKPIAYLALFFTLLLLEAIIIENIAAGPGTDSYWRRVKTGRR
jgi:hypothetical protein